MLIDVINSIIVKTKIYFNRIEFLITIILVKIIDLVIVSESAETSESFDSSGAR